MNIHDLIALIPDSDDHDDEAISSIQSITTYPAENRFRIRCELAHEFRIFVSVVDETITITVDHWKSVVCDELNFLSRLRRVIYEVDEAISEGFYTSPKPASCFLFPLHPPAPSDMDIPVWDEKSGKWYDAEY